MGRNSWPGIYSPLLARSLWNWAHQLTCRHGSLSAGPESSACSCPQGDCIDSEGHRPAPGSSSCDWRWKSQCFPDCKILPEDITPSSYRRLNWKHEYLPDEGIITKYTNSFAIWKSDLKMIKYELKIWCTKLKDIIFPFPILSILNLFVTVITHLAQ